MSRILKRPMFRKGGLSQETGIMSGLDRKGYAGGGNIGGGRISGTPMGNRTGFQQLTFTGMEGPTSVAEKLSRMQRLKNLSRTGLDFFRKGAGMARTGLGSLLSYAPAGASAPGVGSYSMAGGAIAGPTAALLSVPAAVIAAQMAATKQRKKGMYTPEGESYDPETGEILGGPNVDEMGFTEQELAGSDAFVPGRNLTPKEMEKARKAKILQLQKEQISARIKRGDSVDDDLAKKLGINATTGEIKTDEDDLLDIPGGEKKLKGDMESDLMKAFKEYAPIFEKELGLSPEDTKKQMYMQLAKFGAGLAAQPGGDLVGAIGRAAEKPLEGAGEVVKDVSTAKRQAKLLALQTALEEGKAGPIGKAINDIAKAYKVSKEEAATIYERWQTNNNTANAAITKRYAIQAETLGLKKNNQERFINESRELALNHPKLVGRFNEPLPDDWEDSENIGGYFVTEQGQFVRVVEQDGEVVRIAMDEPGFEDKPKAKK